MGSHAGEWLTHRPCARRRLNLHPLLPRVCHCRRGCLQRQSKYIFIPFPQWKRGGVHSCTCECCAHCQWFGLALCGWNCGHLWAKKVQSSLLCLHLFIYFEQCCSLLPLRLCWYIRRVQYVWVVCELPNHWQLSWCLGTSGSGVCK